MVHIVFGEGSQQMKRPGYTYDEHGVGVPNGLEPVINWNHVDGPLLYTSDCRLHWLTYWERFQMWAGLTDIDALDRKHRGRRHV